MTSNQPIIYGFSGTILEKSEDGGKNWQRLNTPSNLPTPTDSSYQLRAKSTAKPKKKLITSNSALRLLVGVVMGLITYLLLGYIRFSKILTSKAKIMRLGAASMVVLITIFAWGILF